MQGERDSKEWTVPGASRSSVRLDIRAPERRKSARWGCRVLECQAKGTRLYPEGCGEPGGM